MDLLAQLNTLEADYKAASDLLEATAVEVEQYKQAAVDAVKTAQDASRALSAKDSAISTLLAEIEGYKGQLAALEAAQKTAEQKAVAIVATQGIAPLKQAASSNAEPTKAEALAEYASLLAKDSYAAGAFYEKHKAAFGSK